MNKKRPTAEELSDLTDSLREKQFLYISSFVDMFSRFQEAVLKVPLRFSALSHLIRNGGSLTPTELARYMLRSKHSITIVIDNLEQEGYITRTRDQNDRRMVHIKITREGMDHVRSRVNNERPAVRKLMASLDEKERDQLVESLKKLRKALIAAMDENQAANN